MHGFGSPTDYQKDVLNSLLSVGGLFRRAVSSGKSKLQILRGFDGLVESGEMLVVLGRPGSGCSTLLKTIAGERNGIYVDAESRLNYQGESRSRETMSRADPRQAFPHTRSRTSSEAKPSTPPRRTCTSRS